MLPFIGGFIIGLVIYARLAASNDLRERGLVCVCRLDILRMPLQIGLVPELLRVLTLCAELLVLVPVLETLVLVVRVRHPLRRMRQMLSAYTHP